MVTRVGTRWPFLGATLFLVALIFFIGPWSDLPLNDDWQYAHFAKSFAEHATFTIDVPVAPSVVGQSIIAWPIIKVFGFSHLALRLLTLFVGVLILLEVDYLLALAAVSAGTTLVALCALVANPLFLNLSTTFMTENYGYCVALLAACIWFRGRRTDSSLPGIVAGMVAGLSFWIRQFSTLVFPALLLAEWFTTGASLKNAGRIARRRAMAIFVWLAVIALFFPWARATGNYTSSFSLALVQLLKPNPVAIFLESGVFLLYMTAFLLPFLIGYGFPRRPSIAVALVLLLVSLTAGFAWAGGVKNGPPSAFLNSSFPFLNNVVTSYGVGPITLTDVYWDNAQTRPHIPVTAWLLVEAIIVFASLGWANVVTRIRTQKSEIGVFGVAFALLSLIAVVFSYQYDIYDRYHYPGLFGLAIALAAFFPVQNEVRLRRAAIVWITVTAAFSTLSVHDYFRWQETRADVLAQAQARGISLSEIDAGYEPNGWNIVEGNAAPAGCGSEVAFFCQNRKYRIGLEQRPADSLVISQASDAWLTHFPDIKLMKRR